VDENADESFLLDQGDDSGPSAPRPAPAPKNKKSASETYTKVFQPMIYNITVADYITQLSQLEHILKRPDSYIGSVESVTQHIWTYDSDSKRMIQRDVKYVPGFFKIIDEILVNAADNKVFTGTCPACARLSPP
jgi:DNA topoisomerase II